MTGTADGEFVGQSIVVTGAARGMGAAIAEHFVKAGGAVSLWDIQDESVQSTAERLSRYGKTQASAVDIADEASVAGATEATVSGLGKIDVLVNAAGIAGVNATVDTFPVDVWRKVMDVNLTGVFLCCRAVVPHMRKLGRGRIVNIASVAGKEGNPNASAYSASKAGVLALTKSLGKELATENITVNAITPAVIKTEMLADVSEKQIGYMLAKIPMGRMGTVGEVAEMTAFLASDRATFSTGAVFDMTGGRATY